MVSVCSKGRRMLAVEPSDTFAAAIRASLSRFGHFCIDHVKTAEEALERILQYPPELITIEINLSEMSGLDLLKHLQANPATQHIPVVVVTTRVGQRDIEATQQAGAIMHIHKPFNPLEFALSLQGIFS